MKKRFQYISVLFFILIADPFVSHADAFPPGSCFTSKHTPLHIGSSFRYLPLSPGKPVFDSIAFKLLAENAVFMEYWRNDMTFVYDDFDPSVLPETIELPLLGEDENFVIRGFKGISSVYGPRWGRTHHGLDFALTTGDTVVAAFDGVVRFADYNKSGYGNCVVVRHLNGLETLYGHLSKISVQPNQFVKAGELLGLGGSTGRSTGPHLHFETRYKDYSFDPLLFIDKDTRSLKTDRLVIKKKSLLKKRYSSDKSLDKEKSSSDKSASDSTIITKGNRPVVSIDSSKLSTSVPVQNKKDSSVALTNKQPQKTESPKKEQEQKTTAQKKTTPEKNKQGKNSKKEEKPKKKAPPAFHIVKSGESLWTISRKYGMAWEKLAKLNNLKKEAILKPGQKLKLK
jgi:LysM repeat protein